jgi:hypothetical protein
MLLENVEVHQELQSLYVIEPNLQFKTDLSVDRCGSSRQAVAD